MNNTLRYEVCEDGVALILVNVAGKSMNVFTAAFAADLSAAVSLAATRPDVRGIVVASEKSNGFMAGADLKDFVNAYGSGMTAREAAEHIAGLARPLRALEQCGKPVAAAINGMALGGGFELCLACHHRVLSDDPRSVIGFPEVTVGLLPGGGGTQRLPRLIGIAPALPLLLSGKHVSAKEALALGLVDAVVPAAQVVDVARAWVLAHPDAVQPWDVKGFKVPGGAGALASHAAESFGTGLAKVRRDTQDNYPAPLRILAAVYEGTQLPIDRGLQVEAQLFGTLLAGPVARNLIRTQFINKTAAQKLVRRPSDVERQTVRKLGVLGAGMMGAGIAQVAAAAGIEVVLLDLSSSSLDAARSRIAAAYEKEKATEIQARLDRILATTETHALAGCDLIVEAVFEDRDVKRTIMEKVRAAIGEALPNLVWASNTSTLPISGLAEHWTEPSRVIGLHFFSPVARMLLVEVILGKQTSDFALARALDFVQQLRKIPIVVNDSPGFYTTRIFCAYIDEGMAMLREGIAPALIENAARQAGFPTGPLAVTDEVSLDLQKLVIDQATADGLEEKFLRKLAQPVVRRMNELGRLGRKAGGGFYDYNTLGGKRLWRELATQFPLAAQQPSPDEVRNRLLCIQALEAARCIEEGVVTDPADADIGSVLGLGFPSWTGGAISYIETIGMKAFVDVVEDLATRHGDRFRPSPWLKQRADAGTNFYPPVVAVGTDRLADIPH